MERVSLGLRARLLLLVLFAMVPAFAVIVYSAVEQFHHDGRHMKEDATGLVQLATREQQRLIQSTHNLLLSLSQLPQLRSARTAVECRRVLQRVHISSIHYSNLGVADLQGNVFCSALPMSAPVNIRDRGYFHRAVTLDRFAIGEYQLGRITGKPTLNFGYPVHDDAGRVAAVVYAALDLNWLDSLLAVSHLPPAAVVTVLDHRGTVLARAPDPDGWTGRSAAESALFTHVAKRRAFATHVMQGLDGVTRMYAFAPLQTGDRGETVYVSAGIAQDVVSSPAFRNVRRNVALLLIAATLAVIAAWIGASMFILRRTRALDAAAQRLAHGDFGARTGLPHGSDELGRVARTFDSMAAALQRVNRALKTLGAGNRALVRAADEQALLREMCRILVEVGGFRFAWIGYAHDDEQKTLQPVMEHGFPGGLDALLSLMQPLTWADAPNGEGPVPQAIRSRKAVAIRNIGATTGTARWQHAAARLGFSACVALPLIVHDKVIGGLGIYSDDPNAFDTEEIELLNEAAEDLSFGIGAMRTRLEHDWAQATLADITRYDKLTGLPNHSHFEEHLNQALTQANPGEAHALLVIGFQRLSEIVSALGFDQGDSLLREASARLRVALDEDASAARMRGKEFAVLLSGKAADRDEAVAQRLIDALREPFTLGGLKLEVSPVIGIARAPADGNDPGSLLRHADVAMQQAKKSGKDYLFYRAEFESGSKRRLELAAELRHALENNELVLHYQPKLEMSGRLSGAEALVRWRHPSRGMIAPNDFIALAEQTGLIKPLAEWVLETAMRQSALWHAEGFAVPIAINLSARNLHDTQLVRRIESLLASFKADASWLEIEITESVIMDDPEGALAVLTRLSNRGIALYIDDFGTGYSSLGYLKKLPVDAVKIDKSFVQDMLSDKGSAAIVRSTINLAHELGLKVVAEGVENETLWIELEALHCDAGQGYHISRPLPPDQFKTWLARHAQRNVAG